MKKLLITAALLSSLNAQATETLTVGATAVPHAQILEVVKPVLAQEGIDLKIKVFTDYVQPNVQVEEKHLDANFFQHQPYLNEFNKTHKTNLVGIAGIHIEPFGIYSQSIKNLKDVPEKATVAIPNDATNAGRALLLLAKSGLITLKPNAGITASPKDIISNPKKLKITELEAASLPRVLKQVDLALINTNYALEADLNPTKDALLLESSDSPYVNILVVRADRKDDPKLQKLAQALKSPEVKAFIKANYDGAVVPAF